ncbi:MAG TPA: DUF4386 domain-containing protein [Bacteroidota bacterium]
MTTSIDESQRKALRTAGLLYFLMAITAPFGLLYVPSTLIVPGDATATAENIRASEWLLRVGIGSELFHQAIAVFLVMALYRLFKPVNENHAKLLVVLGALVSVPIMFLNVLNEIAALILVSGAGFLSTFETSQLDALALLFLRLHEQGINVASIFWGLWLFPFGILVMQSGFIPRLLGVLLLIAGFAYLSASFTSLVVPQYENFVGQFALVLAFGELPIVFWFVIKGFRPSGITAPDKASG